MYVLVDPTCISFEGVQEKHWILWILLKHGIWWKMDRDKGMINLLGR